MINDSQTAPSPSTIPTKSVEGNDAVCFTAGAEAGVVGVGTIHAYLASRRRCPKVVAGISLGALNAAAMQRSYRELGQSAGRNLAEQEAARWKWFRHYLETLSDRPLDVFWKAIPDQSDFFADMIPIRDTSVPDYLAAEEAIARRRQYLLVKLGRWLARLPVSVSLVTGIVVNLVRIWEKYPLSRKAISLLAILAHVCNLATRLILYACWSPQFFPEHSFRDAATSTDRNRLSNRCRIPIFGWLNLFGAALFIAVALVSGLALYMSEARWRTVAPAILYVSILVAVVVVLIGLTARLRRKIMEVQSRRQLVFRLLTTVAYLFSVLNIVLLAVLGVSVACVLFSGTKGRGMDEALVLGFAAAGTAVALYVMCAPLVLVPGTRRWLIDRRFLRVPPHPLFGWIPLLVCLVNIAAFLIYVALGVLFIWLGWPPGRSRSAAEYAIFAVCLFGATSLLPVAPAGVSLSIWRHWLQGFANARTGRRKAFAWIISGAVFALLFVVGLTLWYEALTHFRALVDAAPRHPVEAAATAWRVFALATCVLAVTWVIALAVFTQPVLRRRVVNGLLGRLGLRDSVIHDLYLRVKLLRLFDPLWAEHKHQLQPPTDVLTDDPMPIVLVAASLQTLTEGGRPKFAYQLWPKTGTPFLHALRAALAIPPVFAPVRLTGDQLAWWLRSSVRNDPGNQRLFKRGIDLVDGSVVRQNPLPALYSFLRNDKRAQSMVAGNDSEHPAVHVVYGVPIPGQDADRPAQNGGQVRNTIVDVALLSLRLSQRRDTQLEVTQTNVISGLERLIPPANEPDGQLPLALFADEIAPEAELSFKSLLNPTRDEILTGVAAGCRRSLEALYRPELTNLPGMTAGATIACRQFLTSIGKLGDGHADPGLPEVCGRCTGQLRTFTTRAKRRPMEVLDRSLGDPVTLVENHPQLAVKRPRIVFVASGGVFRGAFHIGMLAALWSMDIKPDLVVGASVGTLMSGALAAMFARDHTVLAKLVDAFVRVDETVALTLTLKNAAREIGLRGRAIDLSPRDVLRMVRLGARSDPSFASTGAPAALIDAISDLLMIPHQKTGKIAADFIAGRVTSAASRLVGHLRTETIRRLDVQHALLGTSLLEDLLFQVLTDGTSEFKLQRQPYQSSGIAFYGTTTNLNSQRALLLGGAGLYPNAPYDFIEATLASSAFPAVFAPRRDSQIFPGTGLADVFFADGGMFDNLPFVPAIHILAQAQRGYRRTKGRHLTALDFLNQRLARPDLFIAGALNAVPEYDEGGQGTFPSLAAIHGRAMSLQNNSKIRSFELAGRRIYGQLLRLAAARPPRLSDPAPHRVDTFVNAAVLPVFPSSKEHLNGTFAFCASTGLDRRRVLKSVADGCYATRLVLAAEQETARSVPADELQRAEQRLTAKAVDALVNATPAKIPRIQRNMDLSVPTGLCPYFMSVSQNAHLPCPFGPLPGGSPYDKSMAEVHALCRRDRAHHKVP